MREIPNFAGDVLAWQTGADNRLRLSMLLSTVVVIGILSLIRLPSPGELLPLLELVIDLNSVEKIVESEPLPDIVPIPRTPEPVEEVTVTEPAAEPLPFEESAVDESASDPLPPEDAYVEPTAEAAPVDWEVLRDEAIKVVLDEAEKIVSVNPTFEKKRREASVRFRASLAPDKKQPWDGVEKDYLGRTLLRFGDGTCYKVLDDPGVANRWAFETFEQHLVFCEFTLGKRKGRELPWVEEIRQRYPYLRDPVLIP